MTRLYLDEDAMRGALVRGLRARHLDVQTAHEAEMINREDEDHLLWATRRGRAIYTYNSGDFAALHARWLARHESHAGIIIAPQRLSVGDQIRGVVAILRAFDTEGLTNRLVFLSAWREPR